MWNWIEGEFYTFLIVMERYQRVWIRPCIFFLFCIGLMVIPLKIIGSKSRIFS